MSVSPQIPAPTSAASDAVPPRSAAPRLRVVDNESDERDIEAIRHYYRTDFVERELHDCIEGAAHLPHHL